MPTKNKPVLPDYLKDLPGGTLVSAKDMCKIYRYTFRSALTTAIMRGTIPKPDIMSSDFNFVPGKTARIYWKLSTIRKLIKND